MSLSSHVSILESDVSAHSDFENLFQQTDCDLLFYLNIDDLKNALKNEATALLICSIHLGEYDAVTLFDVIRTISPKLNVIFIVDNVHNVHLLRHIANDSHAFYFERGFNKQQIYSLSTEIFNRLRKEKQEKQALASLIEEIKAAAKMQKLLLPAFINYEKDIDLLTITNVVPYSHLTGDYVEYIRLPSDKVVVIIGDITGHGVKSAIYMSIIRSLTHTYFKTKVGNEDKLLENYLIYINYNICHDFSEQFYMTCLLVLADPKNNCLDVINAGHPRSMWYNEKNKKVDSMPNSDHSIVPLGWFEDYVILESSIIRLPFEQGVTFLFFTDGLIEILNKEGEQLGYDTIVEIFNNMSDLRRIAPFLVLKEANKLGYSYLKDDVSLVTLSRKPIDELGMLRKNNIDLNDNDYYKVFNVFIIEPTFEKVREVSREIRQEIYNFTQNKKLSCLTELAIGECLNNIIIHGKTKEVIGIRYYALGDILCFEIIDKGIIWRHTPKSVEVNTAQTVIPTSGRGLRIIKDIGFDFKHFVFDTLNYSHLSIKLPPKG